MIVGSFCITFELKSFFDKAAESANVLILCLATEQLRFPLFIIFRARVFEEQSRLHIFFNLII